MTALLSILGVALQLQGVTLPPPPRGFSPTQADMVVDEARVLDPSAVERMNRMIFAVKSMSGGEIVVVTLPDIGGREAGDVALALGREWKVGEGTAIGSQSRNAGLVVLLVPRETATDGRGQISISTGQGTEGFITDGIAGDIRREATPYFRQQDYSAGIELITQRVAQRYASAFGFALDSAVVNPRFEQRFAGREVGISPVTLLIIFIILLFLLSAIAQSIRRSGGRGCLAALVADAMTPRRRGGVYVNWGGGGFGGGSWGGGGGGFGGFGGGGGFSGGGSSGSW